MLSLLAKLFQVILLIPSIAGWIKQLWALYLDKTVSKSNQDKADKLKTDTEALKKAQEDGDVKAQQDALDRIIDDGSH